MLPNNSNKILQEIKLLGKGHLSMLIISIHRNSLEKHAKHPGKCCLRHSLVAGEIVPEFSRNDKAGIGFPRGERYIYSNPIFLFLSRVFSSRLPRL